MAKQVLYYFTRHYYWHATRFIAVFDNSDEDKNSSVVQHLSRWSEGYGFVSHLVLKFPGVAIVFIYCGIIANFILCFYYTCVIKSETCALVAPPKLPAAYCMARFNCASTLPLLAISRNSRTLCSIREGSKKLSTDFFFHISYAAWDEPREAAFCNHCKLSAFFSSSWNNSRRLHIALWYNNHKWNW